jgi:predicted Zn-dependent protease with MMP-like domain
MDPDLFESFVADAIEALPEVFREAADNVMIVVEDWPDRATLQSAGIRSPAQLLGFYHGVPQTGRTTNYGMVTPDKISIYRRPIELRCRSEAEVRDLVTRVVHHELAHHFGIDDDRLEEIGAY